MPSILVAIGALIFALVLYPATHLAVLYWSCFFSFSREKPLDFVCKKKKLFCRSFVLLLLRKSLLSLQNPTCFHVPDMMEQEQKRLQQEKSGDDSRLAAALQRLPEQKERKPRLVFSSAILSSTACSFGRVGYCSSIWCMFSLYGLQAVLATALQTDQHLDSWIEFSMSRFEVQLHTNCYRLSEMTW